MVSDENCGSWCCILSCLMLAAVLVLPLAVGANPLAADPSTIDCELNLPASPSVDDLGAAVKVAGIRDNQLECYIPPLLDAGIAPADIAEGLLSAGFTVFDVVRAIVVVGGADVVVDIVARINTVQGPTVSQTVRDAVEEAVRVRGAGAAIGDLDTRDCALEVSEPISAEGIGFAVEATGVRDELLECYVVFLLKAGVAPADIAEGLLLAGYLVSDVVRTVVMVGGGDVAGDIVARSNIVYCRTLTKGSACGSAISPVVADAALAGAAAAAGPADTDSSSEFMALVAAGEIAAGARRLDPSDGAGGVPDISLQ